MSHQPPDNLIERVSRLGLATRPQVEGVAWRVRRLAGELPLFESVWVDALCQARLLTPFQAAEMNAGRGERLLVGPYVLCRGLASNGLGQWFVARRSHLAPRDDGVVAKSTTPFVRLLRSTCPDRPPALVLEALKSLVHDLEGLKHHGLSLPYDAGLEGADCWIACAHVEGVCAADWLAHNGRLPPVAVLEIARQMAASLTLLESRGRLHSDLGARQLILTRTGQAVLPLPGVRAIFRPEEGYTRLDLLPEGYDYLAPERISAGTPADTASELFACGCLWWHLLCGRPPLSGGDCLGKVRSAQQGRLADVRRFAPDTPPLLLDAIAACTQLEPRRRPRSMAELATQLGAVGTASRAAPGPARLAGPTASGKAGRAVLARCLTPTQITPAVKRKSTRAAAPNTSRGLPLPAVAAVALIAAWGAWWMGRGGSTLPLTEIRGAASAAVVTAEPPSAPPMRASQSPAAASSDHRPADLVLPGGRVRLTELRLQAGQTVRGAPGQRTLVITPPEGLSIDAEDVRFEDLDFTAAERTGIADASQAVVLVQLRAYRAAFHACSFQGPPGMPPPVAIDWPGPPAAPGPGQSLPTGRLSLSDCVFHRVQLGIFLRAAGALRVDLSNSLCLASGAWLTLDHLPRADETVLVLLSHATLRGGRAVLELPSTAAPTGGEIQLRAEDCAFAPARGGGLVALFGPQPEESLLRRLRIGGQGSILSPDAPVALWQGDYGAARALADEQIEAAGLVRSPIGFAGERLDLPAASRVVRWQAPRVSPDPPGILERPLFLPGAE